MKKDMLDKNIARTLHDCVDGMTGTELLDARVRRAVQAKRRPARGRRVAVIAAAAALCLSVTGAMASGRVAQLISHTSLLALRSDAAALTQDAAQIADGITVPETLGDFTFENGGVESVGKLDENGKSIGSYQSLDAYYQQDGDSFMLTAHAWAADLDGMELQEDNADKVLETREVDGVTVTLKRTHYLFISQDYELTPEQQAAEAAHELMVSVGGESGNTCEESDFTALSWEKDGVVWMLGGHNLTLDADTLFALAADAMQA